MACNICGSAQLETLNGRENAFCKACGSYERTRVMALMIDAMALPAGAAILHLAPERGLSALLMKRPGLYVAADFDTERYSHIPDLKQIDLCKPGDIESLGEFDLIIHSHVIEHVPCNYTSVLIRLHRRLRPGGIQMMSMPIYGRAFEEDLWNIGEEEATRRFGQYDHCRRFSPNDLDRTLGAVFRLPKTYDLAAEFGEQTLKGASIPGDAWSGFTGHTVFRFADTDLLL